MSDATHNKSFDSGLTPINEVRKRIDYIPNDIYIFYSDKTGVLKLWQGTKILHTKEIFHDMECLV